MEEKGVGKDQLEIIKEGLDKLEVMNIGGA